MTNALAIMILSCVVSAVPGEAKESELVMSLDDTFVVADTEKWAVTVERYMVLLLADVRVAPKEGGTFSLELHFRCDTPDLSKFDTPEKMKKAIEFASKPYLPYAVEKEADLKDLVVKGRYGFRTVLTDKALVEQTELPPGEYRYVTVGMVRLSEDSALGFSLYTNEVDGTQYKELMAYIAGFAKAADVESEPAGAKDGQVKHP